MLRICRAPCSITEEERDMSFYDYTVPAADGSEISMKAYEGKVVLVATQRQDVDLRHSMSQSKICMKNTMIGDWRCSIFLATSSQDRRRVPTMRFTSSARFTTTRSSLR